MFASCLNYWAQMHSLQRLRSKKGFNNGNGLKVQAAMAEVENQQGKTIQNTQDENCTLVIGRDKHSTTKTKTGA